MFFWWFPCAGTDQIKVKGDGCSSVKISLNNKTYSHVCSNSIYLHERQRHELDVLESVWWLFGDGWRGSDAEISCERRYLKNCCWCWWWFEPVWCRDSTVSSAHRYRETQDLLLKPPSGLQRHQEHVCFQMGRSSENSI